MRFLLSFTKEDIARLYLTYHRNPENYAKIREKVLGDGAKANFRKDIRGRYIFLLGISFIAIVSMLYPATAGDWQTVASLAVIWGIFVLVFMTWILLSYRFSFRVMKKNEEYIQRFELIADANETVGDFLKNWKPIH